MFQTRATSSSTKPGDFDPKVATGLPPRAAKHFSEHSSEIRPVKRKDQRQQSHKNPVESSQPSLNIFQWVELFFWLVNLKPNKTKRSKFDPKYVHAMASVDIQVSQIDVFGIWRIFL